MLHRVCYVRRAWTVYTQCWCNMCVVCGAYVLNVANVLYEHVVYIYMYACVVMYRLYVLYGV